MKEEGEFTAVAGTKEGGRAFRPQNSVAACFPVLPGACLNASWFDIFNDESYSILQLEGLGALKGLINPWKGPVRVTIHPFPLPLCASSCLIMQYIAVFR